jgi:glycosyltransferase involved in cell wall biosynthesis
MRNLRVRNRFPTQPWKTSTARRLEQLRQALDQGLSVNLMLYEQPDASTFRYRIYNVAQSLEQSNIWRAVYFFANELQQISNLALRCHLVTVVRFRWTFELDNFLTRLRRQRIPIAYDSDDLVFDLAHVPALANIQNLDWRTDSELNFWFSYVGRVQLAAQLADCWTTTNGHLAHVMRQVMDRPVHVIRNFLNREQLVYSEELLRQKATTPDQKPFVIGYFSGSPSHYFDLHSIADELCDLLDEFPQTELLIVGYMDFAPRLRAYLEQGRIRTHPFVDFLTLQRLIAEVDVNIAPLYPNDFTESKSELKFFEAALVGTITCASPTYTFREAIESGTNGYLCRQGQWYQTIRQILLDPAAQLPLLEKARLTALERYTAAGNLSAIEKACQAMADMVK